MSDTKNIVVNALAIVLIATLFVLAFTWIIIDYNGSSESLKDAWDITGSFFGGITTLLAAYIASRLFNDWRDQHKVNFYEKFYYDFRDKAFYLNEAYRPIKEILLDKNNDIQDPDLLKRYSTLKSDFMVKADYVIQILDDFLYLIKNDDDSLFNTFVIYRNDLSETMAFFQINDPLAIDNKYISQSLIDNNVKNRKIEKGVLGLKELLSLDILDSILLKLR